MPNSRALILPAVIVGIAFIILAVIYLVEPAKSLPLPDLLGHQAGSSTVHVKHGIASLLLGVACFVFAWFQSGPKRGQLADRTPR
jgi:hypothetical protein